MTVRKDTSQTDNHLPQITSFIVSSQLSITHSLEIRDAIINSAGVRSQDDYGKKNTVFIGILSTAETELTSLHYGLIHYADGAKFEGYFDQKNSPKRGRFYSKDGSFYKGTLNKMAYDGFGHLYYADKRLFRGVFKNGCPYMGKLIFPDTRVFTGYWIKGHDIYSGKLFYPGNWFIDGEFRHGLPWKGEGIYPWPDTEYLYEGSWKKGFGEICP